MEFCKKKCCDKGRLLGGHGTLRWDEHYWMRIRTLNPNMCSLSAKLIWERSLRTIFISSPLPSSCTQSGPITREGAQGGWKLRWPPSSSGARDEEAAWWDWRSFVVQLPLWCGIFALPKNDLPCSVKVLCQITTEKVTRKESSFLGTIYSCALNFFEYSNCFGCRKFRIFEFEYFRKTGYFDYWCSSTFEERNLDYSKSNTFEKRNFLIIRIRIHMENAIFEYSNWNTQTRMEISRMPIRMGCSSTIIVVLQVPRTCVLRASLHVVLLS